MPIAVMMLSIENRKDHVEYENLRDDGRDARSNNLRIQSIRARLGIHGVMNLRRRLPDQEQTTGDQDKVSPGKALPEQLEDRVSQFDDPHDRGEQDQAQDQRSRDTDTPGE
jgi:hypothetical protein